MTTPPLTTITCYRMFPRNSIAATSAEQVHEALGSVRASITLQIACLAGLWPEAARPANIVSAIRDLEIARDSVFYEMREIEANDD